jgi:hypothetical protein
MRSGILRHRRTIELTGVHKQSEATLLHVRVERIVRRTHYRFSILVSRSAHQVAGSASRGVRS